MPTSAPESAELRLSDIPSARPRRHEWRRRWWHWALALAVLAPMVAAILVGWRLDTGPAPVDYVNGVPIYEPLGPGDQDRPVTWDRAELAANGRTVTLFAEGGCRTRPAEVTVTYLAETIDVQLAARDRPERRGWLRALFNVPDDCTRWDYNDRGHAYGVRFVLAEPAGGRSLRDATPPPVQ